MRVVLPDLGLSNLASARRALEALGHEPVVTGDPEVVAAARLIVLPGVGAFGEAMRRLAETGIGDAIREAAAAGAGVVGICLGMQLLFDASEEGDTEPGLGLIPGRVVRLAGDAPVPHVGWNRVCATPRGAPLFGDADGCDFYFVHSYVARPEDPSVIAARCLHGEQFVAAVAAPRRVGFQFHPEKSGSEGVRLLGRALEAAGEGGLA